MANNLFISMTNYNSVNKQSKIILFTTNKVKLGCFVKIVIIYG